MVKPRNINRPSKLVNKSKSAINWYFILAGLMVLFLNNYKTFSEKSVSSVKELTVQLSGDVITIKGSESPLDYKFWTKEYKSEFNIIDGSITTGRHHEVSELKKGQNIKIKVSESDIDKLDIDRSNVIVLGISVDGNDLMTTHEFHKNRNMYEFRLLLFSTFAGIMLLVNGINLLSKKLNYIIIGIFIGGVIIMRIFEFWIY